MPIMTTNTYIGRATESIDRKNIKFLSKDLDHYYCPKLDNIDVVSVCTAKGRFGTELSF